MVEICNTEIFNPTCSNNEVIIIEKAQYGRLELGQLVTIIVIIIIIRLIIIG